jgi:hypothetical protein
LFTVFSVALFKKFNPKMARALEYVLKKTRSLHIKSTYE